MHLLATQRVCADSMSDPQIHARLAVMDCVMIRNTIERSHDETSQPRPTPVVHCPTGLTYRPPATRIIREIRATLLSDLRRCPTL